MYIHLRWWYLQSASPSITEFPLMSINITWRQQKYVNNNLLCESFLTSRNCKQKTWPQTCKINGIIKMIQNCNAHENLHKIDWRSTVVIALKFDLDALSTNSPHPASHPPTPPKNKQIVNEINNSVQTCPIGEFSSCFTIQASWFVQITRAQMFQQN